MRKLIPVFLISTFLFFSLALFIAGPTSAQEPDRPPAKGPDPLPSAQNPAPLHYIDRALFAKIEPRLLKKLLVADNLAPFIVYLETTTDLAAAVASIPTLDAQSQANELARRTAIINALQQTARTSQSGVLQLLTNSTAPGGLSGQSVATTDINPLWIVNAVAAKGSLETVLALAARPEVKIIRLDKEIKLSRLSRSGGAGAQGRKGDISFTPLPPCPPAPLHPCFVNLQPPISHPLASLRTSLQSPPWNITKIRADLVHNALGIDGSGVVVANVDTGVDWQHSALQTKYRGYTGAGHLPQHLGNWYDATGDGATYPVDGNGHGTHTMGTMVGDDVGVAPGARWIAVKAFNSAGGALSSWLHNAFEWVLAPNGDPALAPDIVNNSWGNNNGADTEFEADIQALLSAGIYPVFSAGNNGAGASTVSSPGSLNIVFAVGATSLDDDITNFSGRGPSPWGKIKPDISAPGKEVISTIPGGAYGSLDGTSMAAPHVAGLTALLLQASPALTNNLNDIANVITSTAVPLGDSIPNNDYGWGRIDAYNAVLAVAGAGTLQGTVRQAGNGLPIAYATVRITPRSGGPTINTLSNGQGAYSQGLTADKYDVTALAFGYQPATVFNIVVSAGAPTIQDFNLTPTPRGTLKGTVKDKNTNAPLAAAISIDGAPIKTTSEPINGNYSLSLPVGAYTVRAVAANHRVGKAVNITINDGATVTQNFLLDSAPSILLVDSGKWYQESRISYYQQALNDALYTYDTWQINQPFESPSDVPLTSTLSGYDIVIWSAPEDSPGFIGADAALTGFLDQGGKLLLSGQDIAFFDGGGSPFGFAPYLKNYLKTAYLQDNADTDTVSGTVGGPLAGLSLTLAGGDGADNQISPDVIGNADTEFAGSLFSYEGNDLAGLHVGLCVPYRAMFLSFGFEAISNRADRSQVMEQALNWLTQAPAPRGIELTPETETRVGNFGAVVPHTIRVRNTGANNDTYSLSFSSSWPVTPAPPANIALASCQSQEVTFGVRVNTTARHVSDVLTLTAQSTGNPAVADSVLRTTKSPASVLLVDDDRFISFASEFQEALAAKNIPYDYWLVPKIWEGPLPPSPPLDTLQMYPVTVWYTAYDWFQPLLPDEEDRLAAYLDGGGRLFFSSQDYIYNLPDNVPSAFAQNYFGIQSHLEDFSSTRVTGRVDHPVGTHLGPYALSFPPGYNNWTDALTPTSSAQIATVGQEGQPNGLTNSGIGPSGEPWRTVYLSFGPELLAPTHRARLMQRVVGWLGWLGASSTMPHVSAALDGEVINYTATIVNDGLAGIPTAYFTATFPVELALNTYSPELSLSNGNLVWSGPLAKNESKAFNYTATIADPLPIGTVVSQTNWLAYDDHNLLTDRVATVYVNFPDLKESKMSVVPTQGVEAGDVLTYTIVLKNSGLVDDPLVTTTNTLPPALIMDVVDTLSQGAVAANGSSITWTTPLSLNEVATLTYRAVISYRPSTPIDNIAYVNDNLNEPVVLKARTLFEVFPMYFPIIFKD